MMHAVHFWGQGRSLLILGLHQKMDAITIKIGKDFIKQDNKAKLLGMTLDKKQGWTNQIQGKGGVIPSLNSRLFLIKRLKNKLSKSAVTKISESIFNSKICYGLPLLGKIRWTELEPKPLLLKNIQKCQNKMLRSVSGLKLIDKVRTK